MTAPEGPTALRIVTPNATAEEIAAIVAVFAAVGSAGGTSRKVITPEWSSNHRKLRPSIHPGPGAWRSSSLG